MSLLCAKTFYWQLLLYIHNKHESAHVLLLCKSVTAIFVFLDFGGSENRKGVRTMLVSSVHDTNH